MKKKRLFLVLGLSAALCAIIAIVIASAFQDYCGYCDKKAFYLSTSGYATALGVDQFTKEDFVATYGDPESMQRWYDPINPDRELVLHSYPSFDVLYLVTSGLDGVERLSFLQVVVLSSDIHFGVLNIGVGSSRTLVRAGYLFDEMMSREEIAYESHDFPEAEEGFYGDHWWRVLFNYDNAGKVESIAYAISPN